jgi:lipopolysaccharide transport system permease protein
MMVMFTVVFSFLARVPTDGVPYPLFSYAALLPWTFFQTAVSFGVPSLVNNLNLVTKTYFPREILPVGAVGASFFDFLVASTLFFFMLGLYGVSLTWTIAWVPLLLLLQILLTVGVTLLGSAIIVLYRDVRFIVPLALQLWLYATPIIYPVRLVPEHLRPIYMLNPMAGIVVSYRQVILFGQPPTWRYLGVSAAAALALFVVGYITFKRLEASFADII